MSDYTWEDWCWNNTVSNIADALYLDFCTFILRMSKFCRTSHYRMYIAARLSDLCNIGKLSWDELTWDEELEVDTLYYMIVDYIGSNEKYVALIEQAMLEEERGLKDEQEDR